ncbi:MAG: SCO family protein [Streptosporangiaceae bacterium]|jgi:cytochrome oxidase Cu insertion factor (SCO1/SenC/PrrC family)
MNSGLSPSDPVLVAAFRSALLHQGAIALIIIVFLGLAWATVRVWSAGASVVTSSAEPRGRRLLRTGFGLLWIFDGLLQAQPKMAGGLATQVIGPTAAASPAWVQHLVNWGGTAWSYHPVQAAAASVWIQVGIGAWLIAADHGAWSRLAGAASVGWGLIVWVFGESFGGIFAPGLSWLTGAPGGVLFYVAAGALIALPEHAWRGPAFGRRLLAGIGVFFVGMAVLQAWPGRGFWSGTGHGQPGPLAAMVREMAATPQPHFLSALLNAFGSVAAGNGFAVNLFVVIALAAMGLAFLTGRARPVRYAVWFGLAFGLAVWVLVQDLGFLGGLGTDPNSMIPLALLFSAGYLALSPASQQTVAASRVRWRPAAAAGAAAVVLLGTAPMAAAAADRTADPILALALAGDSASMDLPAPGFTLTDQAGRPVSLASLRGKVVLMTFLDPVCTTDCPVIAQELKQTGRMLGAQDTHVELVAVVANPVYRSVAFTQAFDRQEGLTSVPNWLYLTGSPRQLGLVWQHYGVEVENLPAGAMAAHNDLAVVIDPAGNIRREVGADPGPATSGTQSSFAVLLSQYARQALGHA